jgi:hypothetical protein
MNVYYSPHYYFRLTDPAGLAMSSVDDLCLAEPICHLDSVMVRRRINVLLSHNRLPTL